MSFVFFCIFTKSLPSKILAKLEAIFEHRWSGPTECAKPVEIGIRQKMQIFLKVLNTLLPAGAADLIALRAVRQAEFGIAVYCVAELPKRRTCVILGPAFLHRVNYSGIGTHLHEDEPVLF